MFQTSSYTDERQRRGGGNTNKLSPSGVRGRISSRNFTRNSTDTRWGKNIRTALYQVNTNI